MEIKNRNLFRLTRFIIFKVSLLFRFFEKFRSKKKRLLIIKTDAIGDYILSRNFIEIVKTSEAYKNYEVDLLANILCRDIAIRYDAPFISKFLFTRPYDLYEAPLQTLKLGWKLFKRNYEIVLQPAYTRLLINDGLAALTAAQTIIGFAGDNEGIRTKYKIKTDKFYTLQLLLPHGIYFEFDRTKFFFEALLKQKIGLDGPYIPTTNAPKKGIIIVTGAGIMKRSWEREKFLELVQLLINNTKQAIYLAGGPADLPTAQYLTAAIPHEQLKDLAGKTTLPQLVELIGSAALVISNETSAIHIAAATHTPAVCISGGGHFGRFAPYPQHMANRPACAYDKMECFNCNWNCIFETSPNEPYPCISVVSVEKVWLMVKPILSQL